MEIQKLINLTTKNQAPHPSPNPQRATRNPQLSPTTREQHLTKTYRDFIVILPFSLSYNYGSTFASALPSLLRAIRALSRHSRFNNPKELSLSPFLVFLVKFPSLLPTFRVSVIEIQGFCTSELPRDPSVEYTSFALVNYFATPSRSPGSGIIIPEQAKFVRQ